MGGVARNTGFDGVPVIDLEGQLARIVIASGVAIDEWTSRKKTRAERRLEVRVILGGIESAEKEEAIPQAMDRNVSAQLEVAFVVSVFQAATDEVGHSEPGVVRVLIGVLHPAAVGVSTDGSKELGATGLGNQLNDTAADVAVLRL